MISFKHLDAKNNEAIESLFHEEEAGDDYFTESNLLKDKERCYMKINRKYYKLDKDKYNTIFINVNSSNDFIDLEINDGLNTEKYRVSFERNIVQFFEGNSLNGYINIFK